MSLPNEVKFVSLRLHRSVPSKYGIYARLLTNCDESTLPADQVCRTPLLMQI